MVNQRFGGDAVSTAAQVSVPGLMVGAIILFMGSVSGAHLNPGVSLAFVLRGDFPWKRVPGYVVAQMLGAVLATLLLVALLGAQGSAGLTLPGAGISPWTACFVGGAADRGTGEHDPGHVVGGAEPGPAQRHRRRLLHRLAGLWGAAVSGASMNSARSLGPALVRGDFTAWWAYLLGPLAGALVAVGIAWILRGPGGGFYGTRAAQGTLGWL